MDKWVVVLLMVAAIAAVAIVLKIKTREVGRTPDPPPGFESAGPPPVQSDDSTDDQDGPLDPVDATSAMKRLYCLVALVMRGQFEMTVGMAAEKAKTFQAAEIVVEEHHKLIRETNDWLKREGLWDCLSASEKALMEKEPGAWAERDKIDASWRTEAACVIAWSLELIDDIPAYDAGFSDADLLTSVGGMLKPIGARLAAARLRPGPEIDKARDVAEFWLWRARTTTLQRNPEEYPKAAKMPLDQIVEQAALKGEQDGLFKAIDRDFPAFGKAYRDLSDDEWRTMQSMATERLYGLNWMCGYGKDWDEIPCDT